MHGFARVRWTKAREGDGKGPSGPFHGSGMVCSGGEALEPWDRGSGTRAGRPEPPRSAGMPDPVFLRVRGSGCTVLREVASDAATRHDLPARKDSVGRRTPGAAAALARAHCGEGVIRRGVRKPDGGTCRERQTRNERTSAPMSLKGHGTPGGVTRPSGRERHCSRNLERAAKLVGATSGPSGPAVRPIGGRPRGRRDGVEGAANQ